ncbi:MAG TPA: ester cyclase [Chloroflexota bacterium]|nr:ester cyclase [Chloroflexota bacterium]
MSDTFGGGAALSEHNAAIVQRVVEEIWNGGELGLADDLVASDYVNHYGLISDLVRGPEAIKVSVALYRAAFPDFQITAHHLIAQGETVALCWTAWNPRSDGRAAIASRTTRGDLTGMTFCRLVEGKIAESWTSWDTAGVLRQIGVLPPERVADGGTG